MNLAAINLNLLVAFEALLEQRSITKAADQLQMGQPAMSAALSRLRVLFEDRIVCEVRATDATDAQSPDDRPRYLGSIATDSPNRYPKSGL